VSSRADFEPAFAAITREPPDALVAFVAPLIVTHGVQIAAFALENRLPTIAGWQGFPQAGGLMSYAPSFIDHYRRVAPYVDKILKGAKPDELPVEQPTKFELVINLKTAKKIGLTIPPEVLFRADKVIK